MRGGLNHYSTSLKLHDMPEAYDAEVNIGFRIWAWTFK